jgi:hypothetical protein
LHTGLPSCLPSSERRLPLLPLLLLLMPLLMLMPGCVALLSRWSAVRLGHCDAHVGLCIEVREQKEQQQLQQ